MGQYTTVNNTAQKHLRFGHQMRLQQRDYHLDWTNGYLISGPTDYLPGTTTYEGKSLVITSLVKVSLDPDSVELSTKQKTTRKGGFFFNTPCILLWKSRKIL